MSSRPALWLYRIALSVLPRDVRCRDGVHLTDAFAVCVERERSRLGVIGTASAWVHGIVDLLVAAVALRSDRRRARRIQALGRKQVARGDPMFMTLWQDVRYAGRRMWKAPVFSAAVMLTLALAIGATTAIFSVVDTVLLRSLPYRDADRLVMLYQEIPKAIPHPIGFSPPDYHAFLLRASGFESIAAFRNRDFELSGVNEPERITAAAVAWSLFDTLGVGPALGRAFSREEDEGRQPVAILADSLWRRKFGADPAVIGKAVVLDRRPYTIVGVMPARFTFPNRGPVINDKPAELYVPVSFTDFERGAFGSMYNHSVVARLKPGVDVSQADVQVRTAVTSAAREMYPASLQTLAEALSASAVSLQDEIVGRSRTLLFVLFTAVAVVLLIACADIANLMLTRAVSRQREMAVRTALGAARGRLIRQTLVESSLLAVAGAALGLLVARWVVGALIVAAPETLPRLTEIRLDGRILGFTVALSLLTALLCGLLPAIEATRAGETDSLKEGGRTGVLGRRQRRIFQTLVTAQFALAVVLLIGGGLLLRSFNRLLSVDPGFRAEHVLTLATSLPGSAYPRGADVRSFYTRLLSSLEQLPGASAVAASTDLPLGIRERRAFTIEAETEATKALPHGVSHDWVAGRYFEALGIPLKHGRYLSPNDTPASELVVVINETMARTYWRDRDPIGERIAWGGPQDHGPWMRIVGVVADVKQGPLHSDVSPQTFQPWLQVRDSLLGETVVGALRSLKISVRTEVDPMSLAAAVQARIRTLDPSLPVTAVRTLEQVVENSAAPQRFNTIMLTAFALLALLLAALGIGGVLATSISRRTQEMGIRMALGARRGTLLRMVLGEGMALALIGLAIGLPVAFALTRLMAALLFDVSPRDPLTFAAVCVLLIVVALAASYIPARRATAIDPMAALRRE
jgi:putative ABC transport system permease protein